MGDEEAELRSRCRGLCGKERADAGGEADRQNLGMVTGMAKKKGYSFRRFDNAVYRIFTSNLDNLRLFVSASEQLYEEAAEKLLKRARKASGELEKVEKEMTPLDMQKTKLSKSDEHLYESLDDKADDLLGKAMVSEMLEKSFKQFPKLVRRLSLVYLVTIFEAYISDIIEEILLVRPGALKPANKLNYAAYLNNKFDIDVSDLRVNAEAIVEIRATRHIHIHNKGIIDEKYIKQVKDSEFKFGDYRPVTQDYLKDSIDLVHRLAKFINEKVQEKYFS